MNKFSPSIYAAVLLSLIPNFGFCWTDLPTSSVPEEFEKQAEEYILRRASSGDGLRQLDHPELDRQFKEDTRDWEKVLAKMIGSTNQYRTGVSGVAFDAAIFRGTATNPEIVAATTTLIDSHISATEIRYEQYSSRDQANHPGIIGGLAGIMARALKVGAPEHLLTILKYFNSEAEDKINLTSRYTPAEVVASLRSYGDERHVAEARKFATRLRNAGKDDLADDIARSLGRIEKEGERSQSDPRTAPAPAGNPQDESSSQNQPGSAHGSPRGEGKSGAAPVAATFAALAALAAAVMTMILRKKKKQAG